MAFKDSVTINQMNYALWAYVPRTTFSLGVSYQGLATENDLNQISSYDGSFLGGFLSVPLISKRLAAGVGILPKSINSQSFFIKDVGIGTSADQTIKVDGTLSEVQFVTSFALSENMSFGAFIYYILGKINDQTRITYNDRSYSDIFVENEYHFYGKGPGFGISAFYGMTPWLSIGARLKFATEMEVYSKQASISTEQTNEEFQDVTFPANWTVGLTFQPFERWVLGGDIDVINWKSGYLFDGLPISHMNNNARIGVGIERVPSKRRLAPYADKMNYRAGAFYSQLNYLSNGEAVDEYGVTLGFGLPITQGSSRLDIALQLGKRGDIEINGLSEMFFRLNFSLSANELWFVRDDR